MGAVLDRKVAEAPGVVLAFSEGLGAAERLARRAALPCARVDTHRFPDGESLVRLPPELPPDVIVYRSLDRPNDKLVELELVAATAPALGARRLTLVAPYLCYMRQDTAFEPGQAVSQRVIGQLLARRFQRLLTVDPHLHRVTRLEQAVPVGEAVCLSAGPLMSDWLAARDEAPLLLGPDEESEQWVSSIAAQAGLTYGVARKQRLGDRRVRLELPDLPWAGRTVVMVDDVASTGVTLEAAAQQLRQAGAGKIIVLVTHGLFVDDALSRLRTAGVDEIHSTDSVPHETNALYLDGLLADALVRC